MRIQNLENTPIYQFDGHYLDTAKRSVSRSDGTPLPLKPKAFETLLYLVRNPGKVIERDEIMDAVWPGTAVEENNLTQHISSIRRLLGEGRNDHRFIVTVPGHGYEFIAPVTIARNGRVSDDADRGPLMGEMSRNRLLAVGVLVLLLLSGFIFDRESATAPDGRVRSIAVLPFEPISEADRNMSFEMGMTNELISKLNGADGLSVSSYQAVKRFAGGNADAVDAGRDLAVDAVLHGTTQISADRIRVSVTLTSVNDSKQLWIDSFDEPAVHVFDVQEEISKRVARALRARLSENAIKRYTNNAEAYQLYLQGKFHLSKLRPGEIELAIAAFRRAVEIDPNYALAYSGIARAHMSFVLSSESPPGEMIERSLEAAEKAVQIDPLLAEAHATQGALFFWFKHDWEASEKAFKTALELDPHLAFTRLYYAVLLGNIGRTAESLDQIRQARAIDPFSAYFASIHGTILVHAGRPEDALAMYGEATKLDPGLWIAHCKAALALIDLRRFDDAAAKAKEAAELNTSQTNSLAFESFALAKSGRRVEAERILAGLLKRAKEGHIPPYHIAVAYMGLDDRENALAWLEKGFDERDPKMVFLRSERFWDGLRSEPRFIRLLKNMRLDQPTVSPLR